MIAKALSREVKVFIFDEPTVGVDVGTRVAIYGFIRDLCEAGAGVAAHLLRPARDPPPDQPRPMSCIVANSVRSSPAPDITQEKVLSHFFEREAA